MYNWIIASRTNYTQNDVQVRLNFTHERPLDGAKIHFKVLTVQKFQAMTFWNLLQSIPTQFYKWNPSEKGRPVEISKNSNPVDPYFSMAELNVINSIWWQC